MSVLRTAWELITCAVWYFLVACRSTRSITDANVIDGRKSSPSFCNTCSLLLTRFRRHMSGLIAADCQWNPQFLDFLVRQRCITGSESCMWDAIYIHLMWLKTNPIQGPIWFRFGYQVSAKVQIEFWYPYWCTNSVKRWWYDGTNCCTKMLLMIWQGRHDSWSISIC